MASASASVRTYLKMSVEQDPGFTKATHESCPKLLNVTLFNSKGLHSTQDFDFGDVLPDAFRKHLDHFEVHAYWPLGNTVREKGVYKHGGARATLDVGTGEKVPRYEMTMRGKDLVQLYNLYEAIRAGTTRPVKSFEGAQSGKSRTELEREIAELRQRLLDQKCDVMEQAEQLAVIRTICHRVASIQAIGARTQLQRRKNEMRDGIRCVTEIAKETRDRLADAGITTIVPPEYRSDLVAGVEVATGIPSQK